MNFSEAKEVAIHMDPADFLTPAKKGGFVCPVCGNGSGGDGTGISMIRGSEEHPVYTCFVCQPKQGQRARTYDVPELYALAHGIIQPGEELAGEAFTRTIQEMCPFDADEPDHGYRDHGYQEDPSGYGPAPEPEPWPDPWADVPPTGDIPPMGDMPPMGFEAEPAGQRAGSGRGSGSKKVQERDFTGYFSRCRDMIFDPDNLAGRNYMNVKRGISDETLKRFGIGYDPNVNGCPAIIIPEGPHQYAARYIDHPKKQRYFKQGHQLPFNLDELHAESDEPIWIVEGQIDALAMAEIGANAIGLPSAKDHLGLTDELHAHPTKRTLIVSLDNDTAGQEGEEILFSSLLEMGFNVVRKHPEREGCKDKDESLLHDKCKGELVFWDNVRICRNEAIREAEQIQRERKEKIRQEYRDQFSASGKLQNFINGISESADTPPAPTGFPTLDKILDGGLFEGLYIVGAISSLGKTTLMMQIMEQIAEAGDRDVLIFALEMGTNQLIARSISRQTYLECQRRNAPFSCAKTSRGITDGTRYAHYSAQELDIIQAAIMRYGAYSDRIYIQEGIGDINAERIRESIRQHIEITGNTPVVLLDYMQIMAPWNERLSDKQNTDKNILELKRISRDFKLPLIAISSLSRVGYKDKISMEFLKESGALEYNSDVVIGLQLEGVGEKGFDVNKAKSEIPRHVEAVILKAREGGVGKTVQFDYQPMFSHFEDRGLKPEE